MNAPTGRPSQFRLRPLTIADFLDETFKLLKANWKALGLLSIFAAVPSAILTALIQAASTDFGAQPGPFELLFSGAALDPEAGDPLSPAALLATFGGYGLAILLTVFLEPLLIAAMCAVVAASYMGREANAMTSLRRAVGQWWKLVLAVLLAGLGLTAGLVVIGLGVGAGFLISGGAGVAVGVIVGLIGILVMIVGALLYGVSFAVIVPVIAIENHGPLRALSRSFRLTSRRFGWYLLTLLLMAIISGIVTSILNVPFQVVAGVAEAVGIDPLSWLAIAAAALVGGLVALPISAVIATLVYFDARVRVEGLDLQVAAAANAARP